MQYEKELYKLVQKAYKCGEVPVAALIVKNDKLIAKAYNKRNKSGNPLYHAEIQCIIKAAKKLKDWRLNGCDLYVSLKPCHMCEEVIKESRIKNVYYYLENNKIVNFKTNYIKILDENSEYEKLLTSFFKKLR